MVAVWLSFGVGNDEVVDEGMNVYDRCEFPELFVESHAVEGKVKSR